MANGSLVIRNDYHAEDQWEVVAGFVCFLIGGDYDTHTHDRASAERKPDFFYKFSEKYIPIYWVKPGDMDFTRAILMKNNLDCLGNQTVRSQIDIKPLAQRDFYVGLHLINHMLCYEHLPLPGYDPIPYEFDYSFYHFNHSIVCFFFIWSFPIPYCRLAYTSDIQSIS